MNMDMRYRREKIAFGLQDVYLSNVKIGTPFGMDRDRGVLEA